MRILLATSRMQFEGGSEVWVLTMLRALTRLGYEAEVFALHGNVICDSRPDFSRHYDVAFICHGETVRALAGRNIRRCVMVCHGVAPAKEQPVPGCDAYVAVSENVQRHLGARGFAASVIRNPVDTELFRPRAAQEHRALFVCSSNGAPHRVANGSESVARAAAAKSGLPYAFVTSVPHVALPDELSRASVVMGIGRCVLEAAACGCGIVSFDNNLGHGTITRENFEQARRDSFSSLLSPMRMNVDALAAALMGPHPTLTDFIVRDHEMTKIAGSFIALARTIRPATTRPEQLWRRARARWRLRAPFPR